MNLVIFSDEFGDKLFKGLEVYSNNEFYIYNLGRRSLSHWSNDMGLPLLKSLPMELTARSEPVARIVANPASPQRFILVSMSCFVFVS